MRSPVHALGAAELGTTELGTTELGNRGGFDDLARRLRGLPPNHPSAVSDARGAWRVDKGNEQGPDGDFWSRASHFESLWKAHEESWPSAARTERLKPVENAQAEEAIATMQRCEPQVTELLGRLEKESPFGARLVGLEHRLKGADRLKEKIAEGMAASLGASVADAAAQISDAVRYTYCFDASSYGRGYIDMCARMTAEGCEMLPARNFWRGDQDYRGINSRWITPEGSKFEVQFHTSESHYAKEFLTHGSYDRLRLAQTSRAERKALNTYQALVCGAIPVPPGVSEIDDMRSWS